MAPVGTKASMHSVKAIERRRQSHQPTRPTTRRVRLVADLGMSLLPGLGVETLTGLVLFLFGHGLAPKDVPGAVDLFNRLFNLLARTKLLFVQDITFQTDLHVWVGYLTTGVIALKAWVSWPTLLEWRPPRFGPTRLVLEKAAAWSLLALGPASYLTGLALSFRLWPLHASSLRDVHLWVSIALVLPLAWHICRFFPTGLKVLTVQARRFWQRRRPMTNIIRAP